MINNVTHQQPVRHQTTHNNYSHQGGKNSSNNFRPQDSQLQQLLSLLLPLLQQLISTLGNNQHCNKPSQPPLQNIQFDEGSPKPITHFGQGSDTPIRSIEFSSDGYQGILEDGSGFNAQIAAGGSDPSPLINGLIVTRADYTNDTATYTLENGTTLTGLKPFYPQL